MPGTSLARGLLRVSQKHATGMAHRVAPNVGMRPRVAARQTAAVDKDLQAAWVAESAAWIGFARSQAADPVFWRFNLPSFLHVLPKPGSLTLDVGCGEGRVGRALGALGHHVIGVDVASSLVAAASSHPCPISAVVGSAAALPFGSAVADLVVLFMVVTDVDDLEGTLEEASRVLVPGGRLCIAMGHPLQGIGDFSGDNRDGPYVVQRPYFEPRRLTYWAERAGRRVALNFVYRPLSAYIGSAR